MGAFLNILLTAVLIFYAFSLIIKWIFRRKMKKLARFLEAGKLTYNDVYTSFQSWRAYAMNFDSWNTIQSMTELFNSLFLWSWGGDYAQKL